ncbi:MAG: RagB/SusD family nutrient uptake outer membrane protein [Bacteroidetes bacterium]|nr:RagB/SusD family nutrient uptake outer membrane protein [Bacteroidota bacterium]
MKIFKKTFILLIAISLLSGCQKNLLDTSPKTQIGSSSMWTTENLADMGVNGVYNALRYGTVGLEMYYFDDYGFTGQSRDNLALTAGTITAGDGLFSSYWQQHYEGISRANDAIKNLPNAPLTPEKKARLIAESKFLRAYFYYKLNQVFKGVPVYLEPVDVSKANKARETEAKVWETIVSDLTDCINEPNLPGRYIKGNALYGRATKAAAYTLRAKVYMWTKDYAKAEADLRQVGALGHTLFQGPYKMLFKEVNEQCPEMIFSVQNIGVDGFGGDTQFYLGSRDSFGSCWNSHFPSPDHVESFENADGSTFNWNTYIPGYNAMTPQQRVVFFLRDGLTAAEIATFTARGADMSKYLPVGNEARIRKAYESRDPRLTATVITPYSGYLGAAGIVENTYTLRWPYRGFDTSAPFDLKTDTNTKYYYLYRKFVAEGASETPARNYCPWDMPLLRYADVVLLLAEAINEQQFKQEAIDLVNSVRSRAGQPILQTTNASLPTYVSGQDNLRTRIRNERHWELTLEGVNLFDEMRWGTWKDKKFHGGDGNGMKQIWGEIDLPYSWKGDYMYKWAIPSTECQMNSNLVQNDGWIN